MPTDNELMQVLRRFINEAVDAGIDELDPARIAAQAMRFLDPGRASPILIEFAADMYMRVLARKCLRQLDPATAEEQDEAPRQHAFWPGLQAMYPRAHVHGVDPVYVRLELLTDDDLAWNITRLTREAQTKLRHADALRAYAASRVPAPV